MNADRHPLELGLLLLLYLAFLLIVLLPAAGDLARLLDLR